MRAFALLLVLVCPLYAFAEGEDAAPPPANWSLGAGISTSVIYITPGSVVGVSTSSVGSSLERRLSESSWLVFGVDGAIDDSEQESVADVSATTHLRSRHLIVNTGVRHVLTGRGALVDVSVLALAQGGYSASSGTILSSDGEQKNSTWLAGASLGIAIDRQLAAGLSLRVATPIAGVWWQASKVTTPDGTAKGHGFSASAYLAPRLELRLAF